LNVLRNAGIDPLVIVSSVNEDEIAAAQADSPPPDIVLALAEAKAADVSSRVPRHIAADAVVIGCDSMLLVEGRLCGKPGSPEHARAQWATMAGKCGQLLSGHSLIRLRGNEIVHKERETDCSTVYFASPEPEELDTYLACGEPANVAGGFTLDGQGGWFVNRIDGHPSNVIGISLPTCRKLLARMGLSIAQLWRDNTMPA
jgi:septum formation protein